MNKNKHVIILTVAIVGVFAVWLLKRSLVPLPEPEANPVAMEHEGSASTDPMEAMNAVQSQIKHLRELEEDDPDNPDILLPLGNLYYDAGMAAPAVEYYDRMLALQPENVNVMVDKATMLRTLDRSAEAVQILKKVVKLNPHHEHAWFNMGVIYLSDLDDQQGAIAAWKKFLEVNPQSSHAEAITQEIKQMEAELRGE